MRSVNLLPPEELRGEGAPTRTGSTIYMIVAALAAAVIGMTVLSLAKKEVGDRQAEVSQLQREEAQAIADAAALKPFADFRAMQEARTNTVASLAQSRFDWERILRELSLVLPSDVWLTNITGTVSPNVNVTNAAVVGSRSTILGPALSIVGCSSGHNSVAAFVTALEDIDGVTRVGVDSSQLPDEGKAVDSGAGGGENDCRTRDFISRFEIVIAFDEVPVPGAATAPSPAPATAPPSQLASSQNGGG